VHADASAGTASRTAQPLPIRTHQGAEPGDRIGGSIGRGIHHRFPLMAIVGERFDDVVLAGEIPVHRAMAQAGAPQDLGHSGLVEPLVREARQSCSENLLASCVPAGLADPGHGEAQKNRLIGFLISGDRPVTLGVSGYKSSLFRPRRSSIAFGRPAGSRSHDPSPWCSAVRNKACVAAFARCGVECHNEAVATARRPDPTLELVPVRERVAYNQWLSAPNN